MILLQRSDLADFSAQGQNECSLWIGTLAHQTLNKTTFLSLLPSFTLQGHLTLATPLQLACSLWCGLSGGEHTTAAPCSTNEMPVREGASGTVKVKNKIIFFKKKERKKTLLGCSCTTSRVPEEAIEVCTAGSGRASN